MGTRNLNRWLAFLVLTSVALAPPRAITQINLENTSPAASAGPAASPSPEGDPADEQQPTFQVEIEVVTVPVTVTNSSGEFVTDLNPFDFRILDNGAPQKIEGFELSSEPISMVVVVETSSRIQGQLGEVGRSGILFTQLILGESGEAAVLSFDRDIKLVQDFTDNPDLVENALRNLKPGAEDARLSDALARALFLLQRRPRERRKVIVVLSEPRDNGSGTTPGYVLRGAQQLGISVYTVGLSSLRGLFSRPANQGPSSPFPPGVAARPIPSNSPPLPSTQSNVGAANVDMLPIIEEVVSYAKNVIVGNPLALYSQGTGAAGFSGGNKENLQQALEHIGRELHNQYLLTYRPNNLDRNGFHGIQAVVMRPGLRVRTRPGYMFTRGGSLPAAPPSNPSADAPASGR
jgi:VWFA-related protein